MKFLDFVGIIMDYIYIWIISGCVLTQARLHPVPSPAVLGDVFANVFLLSVLLVLEEILRCSAIARSHTGFQIVHHCCAEPKILILLEPPGVLRDQPCGSYGGPGFGLTLFWGGISPVVLRCW